MCIVVSYFGQIILIIYIDIFLIIISICEILNHIWTIVAYSKPSRRHFTSW